MWTKLKVQLLVKNKRQLNESVLNIFPTVNEQKQEKKSKCAQPYIRAIIHLNIIY